MIRRREPASMTFSTARNGLSPNTCCMPRSVCTNPTVGPKSRSFDLLHSRREPVEPILGIDIWEARHRRDSPHGRRIVGGEGNLEIATSLRFALLVRGLSV